MGPRRDFLNHPLNAVLAASSHVAIIRALRDAREGMSGRAIARAAGFNHQACREAISKLEGMGILRRLGSGKTQLIRLNFDNALVHDALIPMLEAEREILARLKAEIRKEFLGRATTATIFGSVARREEEPGSDVDLLLVAPKTAKEELLERASALGRKTLSRYGLRVAPIVLTPHELRERKRRSEPLLLSIMSEGVDVLA